MNFFLIIALVIIATIIISLILGWLMMNQQVNKLSNEIIRAQNDINRIPPFLMSLTPSSEAHLLNHSIFKSCQKKLMEEGFQSSGFYSCEQNPTLQLEGFLHPQGFFAILQDHPQQGVFIEMVTLVNDQKLITICSLSPDEMEQAPNAPIIFLALPVGAPNTIHQLSKKLKEELKGSKPHSWKLNEFQKVYQSIYKRRMDWLMQRGGPTIEEIKKRALKKGQKEPDFEEIQTVKDNWKIAIIGHVEDEIKKAFLEEYPMPTEEWEEKRDQIFILHDFSDEDNVATDITFSQLTLKDAEDSNFEDEFEKKVHLVKLKLSGRKYKTVLEEMNLNFPLHKRFEKLAELEHPYKATVYLRPKSET